MVLRRLVVVAVALAAGACGRVPVNPDPPPAPQSEVRAWIEDPTGAACVLVMIDGVFPDPETVRTLLGQPDWNERWEVEVDANRSSAVARLGTVAAESCGAIILTRR